MDAKTKQTRITRIRTNPIKAFVEIGAIRVLCPAIFSRLFGCFVSNNPKTKPQTKKGNDIYDHTN